MPNFAKKIELDDTLTELFLSFLLSAKFQVPPLLKEQENLISQISNQFLISGFILKSCDFNSSHRNLVKQLKYQKKMQSLKQMLVQNEINTLALNLNQRGIEHVFLKGSALNADGIYPSGIRFSRDIDLLVSMDSMVEAYEVLKSTGFKYLNQKTQDSVKYHCFENHFSPMVNKNGTKLELHWRVTTPYDFKVCPLTEDVLANRRISNKNSNIFCPKIEIMIAHLIHHSFKHHRMDLGPILLFDLATIFVFFERHWPVNNDMHAKLGIEKDFELCKKIIERVIYESSFSSESMLMVGQIFKNSNWLRLSDVSKLSNSPVKITRIEIFDKRNFFSRLLSKTREIKTRYQVSYYSAKFWLFFVSDILISVKKVIRAYFN